MVDVPMTVLLFRKPEDAVGYAQFRKQPTHIYAGTLQAIPIYY